MGYDGDIDHDPREGCACDLCGAARAEMDGWAAERCAASVERQQERAALGLDTPAGTVAARRRHHPLVEEDARPGSPAWWASVERAVERRDLAAVTRLCGGQDPTTEEEVDVWVRAMANAPAPAPGRHEVATVAGRVRR